MSRIIVGSLLAWFVLSCGAPAPKGSGEPGSRPQTTERADTNAQASSDLAGVRDEEPRAASPTGSAAGQTGPAPFAASTIDLSKELALVEEAYAALTSSDFVTARAKATAAIDALLARPEAEREAAWLDVLNRAGSAVWGVQDARAANQAWSVVLEFRTRMLPAEHPDLQWARGNLALTLFSLGDHQRARAPRAGARDPRAQSA
ncbi:MAG: hypothetical protein IPJ77_09470 [Planctomycetes bacterium]|nr:hypothetical protein [Planctomycetota bacterium]